MSRSSNTGATETYKLEKYTTVDSCLADFVRRLL